MRKKASPYKNPRMAEELRIELAELVRDLAMEHNIIAGVNEVQVDNARKHAQVYLSNIRGEDEELLAVVERQTHRLESEIFRKLGLPFRLELHFQIDTGPRHAQKIEELLDLQEKDNK